MRKGWNTMSAETLDAFWPSRNSMEHLQNESGLLRALRRDRFQLLIIVGMALSLFVPLRPAPARRD